MIKKAIVQSVQANGTWESKYGVMYKYEVSFDNGDSGEYSSKNENQIYFKEGDEVSYEFIGGKYPKIKPHREGFNNSQKPLYSNNSKDELICRQNALTSAVRSLGEGCKVEEYIHRAEIFKQYTFDGKTPEGIEEMTGTALPF